MAIITDADGRYTWPLPPGNYRVSVAAAGYREVAARVVVRPGTTVRLDFILRRGP